MHPAALTAADLIQMRGTGTSQDHAAHLTRLAVRALIEEAELTPKPALVDERGPGVHTAHDLLQISGLADLVCPEPYPPWVEDPLRRAPFVVVRRAAPVDGMIPVGVRGPLRNQRFAAYLAPGSILRQIAPEQLAGAPGMRARIPGREVPALNALPIVEAALADLPLRWGPTGSVGFELATGLATATPASDLDLIIRVPERLSMATAQALLISLSAGPCGVDVQLETPHGAVSLAEYASGQSPFLLRQTNGPVLVFDPWAVNLNESSVD